MCARGAQICNGGSWSACQGEVKPSTESCNGRDDDCDGTVDEEYAEKGRSCSLPGRKGACATGTYRCTAGKLTCGGPSPTQEVCGNGRDDDCNGKIDEDHLSTVAGDGLQGWLDGQGTKARFKTTGGVAVDQKGNVRSPDLGP